MKLKPITLEQYSKQTADNEVAPLFILNNAYDNSNNEKTQIALHFGVKSESGVITSISVPATWIPIDLTARVHRNLIINDPNFRDLMQKGHLRIVSATVTDEERERGFIGAQDTYKDPSVQEEFNDLFGSDYMNSGDGTQVEEESVEIGKTRKVAATSKSSIAQAIVDRCTNNEPAKTILKTMRQKSVALTADDYRFIMNAAPDAAIKQYCAERLAEV